ncbi:MAG: cadmium-translocating P-type ATPase [Clostridia bacterium]|nr:cadmium-translocating P-type ATPase [Clostridia bacterium]
MKKYKYELSNLDCANCARKIEDAFKRNSALKNVVVNFATSTLSFETENEDEKPNVNAVISRIMPSVKAVEISNKKENTEKASKINIDIIVLIVGLIFAGFSFVIKINLVSTICILVSYVLLMYKTFITAIKKLKNKTIDESALICISAIGAYLIAKPMEGMMVLALYDIGKILEARAVNNTRKSIKELMNIRPEYANVKELNSITTILPEEVQIGDILVIKAGEKVPVDGKVITGKTKLDKSVLTGESMYVSVGVGDEILSGSVNVGDTIEIEATSTYVNSTVSRILELTENATDRKAKTENFVARMAKVYVPIVMALSVTVGIFMPLISNVTYDESIYRALMFLVISCPCAIAISVPLSYFCGIGKASSQGILVKGSDYLDALRGIKTLVMDKTGTITTGKFGIDKVKVLDENYDEKQVLTLCKLGESFSNHPIAKAILDGNQEVLDTKQVTEHKEIAGLGISFLLDGKTILIGNEKLVGISSDNQNAGVTIIYVAVDDKVVGQVELRDRVKDGVKETLESLKRQNIKLHMFTGDNISVAQNVANEVGIDSVSAELLPQDKYEKLEELIETKTSEHDRVAFVGDGINDSPVIARADIGISMGGVGVSSSIEASDVVIMTDEISKVKEAIDISKYTNRIIKQNLVFALGMKITFLTLSLFGLTNMLIAVFADVGVTLMTILNSVRILKKK